LGSWAAQADFISSIEINTKGLTTSGQAIVYNATTKKLEGGSAGDMASGYTPTNYTVADSKFDSHFAGIDTDLGLKAATADVLLKANNLSDLADSGTARTNLGLGTAALADTGTGDGNVVVLSDVGGTVKLPAVDGSQLTGVISSVGALGDIGDVTITSVSNGQVLTYDSGTSEWVNATPSLPSVSTVSTTSTLSAITADILIRASGTITLTLPAASASSVGAHAAIKNVGTGTITIAAAGSDTIDGAASVTNAIQNNSLSVYCISSSAWEIF
jgi:hypothetical protein